MDQPKIKSNNKFLSGMYNWQSIVIYVIAALTFLTVTFNSWESGSSIVGYLIDAFFGVIINSAILYFLFKIGNYFYKKIKQHNQQGK